VKKDRTLAINAFPRGVRTKVPPIKSQGIKTKLVPFIFRSFSWEGDGAWIEPFFGTGVVAFNAAPRRAIVADTNSRLIGFYAAVQKRRVTPKTAKLFLQKEGASLLAYGEDHYYAIRDRFNREGDPLDFLFLNRSCFNGMIRFNRKGAFNVPFCRKPGRFRPTYITKIVNQIEWIAHIIRSGDWEFVVSDWEPVLASARRNDFVYLDPPYIGRHTDYYDSWDEHKADALASMLRSLSCGFAYSMWSRNRYRKNERLIKWFSDYPTVTEKHFYHVGPTESLRNEMEEALVVSPQCAVLNPKIIPLTRKAQLSLL
jgi:DNA adenine methylase